ncbi:RZZ complex, subunit zwilch [Chytriomyces cf. hyalinus JEL632]|nr:RZZ complex, subunit zwilch [Chytriomyces cf. hyalinus JEL632]
MLKAIRDALVSCSVPRASTNRTALQLECDGARFDVTVQCLSSGALTQLATLRNLERDAFKFILVTANTNNPNEMNGRSPISIPLVANFVANQTVSFNQPESSETLSPLSKQHARYFLSLCAETLDLPKTTRFTTPILPIYVLCRNEITGVLSYMGMTLPNNQMQVQNRLPLLANIDDCGMSSKENGIPFSASSIASPLTKAHAVYSILDSEGLGNGGLPTSSRILLEVDWSTVTKLLSPPACPDAITLVVDYVPGHLDPENHFCTLSLRRQLELLSQLETLVSCSGTVEDWLAPVSSSKNAEEGSCESAIIDAQKVLENFLEELCFGDANDETSNFKTSAGAQNAVGGMAGSNLLATSETLLPLREDLDFTEKLWNLCCELGKGSDIKIVFSRIAEELKSGALQPMISKNNTTCLAIMIRECLKLARTNTSVDFTTRQQAVFASVDEFLADPLNWLLEIGVWKMRRDYNFHLTNVNLANWKQLDPFIGASVPAQSQITQLKQLHNVVEIWSLLHMHVPGGLPQTSARALVAALLDRYNEGTMNEDSLEEMPPVDGQVHVMLSMPQFQAESHTMMEAVCHSQDPILWKLLLHSEKFHGFQQDSSNLQVASPRLVHVTSKLNILFSETTCEEDGQYLIVRASFEA